MKYRLKDLCSITKGATGIMKADGGKYPLVALGEERKQHSEYQFDAKAVIVPLISSTGHGHASMKRVHYQEGKFALGNILCAVISNDEKQLHPKYLHLYLQQFKDSLLVPLMKGAANVSLPMNKLADVEIEVPILERQLEIIELEEEAAEFKNELEERLIAQDGDVAKLRQALLREAMQGKLTKQDAKDGNGKDLLEKIKAEKAKLGKKEKPLPPIKSEEIPFDIPKNWAWCRLASITNFIDYRGKTPSKVDKGIKLITAKNVKFGFFSNEPEEYISERDYAHHMTRGIPNNGDILFTTEAPLGNACLLNYKEKFALAQRIITIQPILFNNHFLLYSILSEVIQKQLIKKQSGVTAKGIKSSRLVEVLIPLPPLAEQKRIVEKLEQLMKFCEELQNSIQQSKIENEKLLQGALRDALKKEVIHS